MDALLDQVRTICEGQIDFEGQRLAELLCNLMLTTVGFFAFLIGFATQNISYSLWTGLGGTALTFLVVVPSWPFFNQHPVQWLPPKKGGLGGVDITVDGKKIR